MKKIKVCKSRDYFVIVYLFVLVILILWPSVTRFFSWPLFEVTNLTKFHQDIKYIVRLFGFFSITAKKLERLLTDDYSTDWLTDWLIVCNQGNLTFIGLIIWTYTTSNDKLFVKILVLYAPVIFIKLLLWLCYLKNIKKKKKIHKLWTKRNRGT